MKDYFRLLPIRRKKNGIEIATDKDESICAVTLHLRIREHEAESLMVAASQKDIADMT